MQMIDADQLKAARALARMTQDDLAAATGLSAQTIKRMESIGTEKSSAGNVQAVQRALEAAGVVFIPENGGGAGVRLAKPRGKREGSEV
jgi:transcriptional regulator with XRE-family HTH domain